LERGVATKVAGANPAASTLPNMMVYAENIVNIPANMPAGLLGAIQASYPAMFPGGAPIPMFRYGCATATGAVLPCTAANAPRDIVEVDVTIIALSPNPDPRNNQPRLVTLTGRARRLNPN
jgi:hypothetical protein